MYHLLKYLIDGHSNNIFNLKAVPFRGVSHVC